jgi:hypothetical protein
MGARFNLGGHLRAGSQATLYMKSDKLYFGGLTVDLFWTIVVILVVLWLVGFVALPGIGSLIHILLVIAVIVVIYRLATGRNVVTG